MLGRQQSRQPHFPGRALNTIRSTLSTDDSSADMIIDPTSGAG
jgi:hypothetical protein